MGGLVVSLVRRVRIGSCEQDRHEVLGICLTRVHTATPMSSKTSTPDVGASQTSLCACSGVDVDAHMPFEAARGG